MKFKQFITVCRVMKSYAYNIFKSYGSSSLNNRTKSFQLRDRTTLLGSNHGYNKRFEH